MRGGGGTQVFLVLTTSVQQVYVIPSATLQRLCNLLQLSKDDSKVHTLAIDLVEPDKSEDGTSDPVSECLQSHSLLLKKLNQSAGVSVISVIQYRSQIEGRMA